MAAQVEITFNSDGFKQILLSDGTKALVQKEADKIAAKANGYTTNGGFVSKVWQGGYGGGRWIGSVNTTDFESMVAESEGKALTRSVK